MEQDDHGMLIAQALDREVTRLTSALEMIAGRQPAPDNLMGNKDIAIAALDKRWPFAVRVTKPDTSGDPSGD